MNSRRLILVAIGLSLLQPAQAELQRPTPAFPKQSIYDETATLKPATLNAVQSLLIEHQQLTGEQIIIAFFKNLQGQDFSAWSQKVFTEWQAGNETFGDDGILLAIDSEEKKSNFITGYSLESDLSEDTQDKILSDFIQPDLKKGDLDSAAVIGAYRTLEALNSPLIQSGKAEEILQANQIISPAVTSSGTSDAPSWLVVLIVSILAFLAFLGLIFFILTRRRTGEWKETLSRWIPGRSKDLLSGRDMSTSLLDDQPEVQAPIERKNTE